MDLDLASLVQNVISASAGNANAITQIGAMSKAGQDAAMSQADNANATAEAEAEKTRLTLEEKARQEQNINELQLRLSANPLAAGTLMSKATQQVVQGYADANDAEARIHAKQSVGFFDNPAQWLINKVTVNKDIEDYRDAATRVNLGEAQTDQLNKLFSDDAKQLAATSNVYSQAFITASTTVAAAAMRDKAFQAQIDASRIGIQGIQAATSISNEDIRNKFMANSAQMQAKNLDIELQRLQLARENAEYTNLLKDDKIKSEKVAQDYVAAGYLARTGKVLPADERSLAATKLQMKDPTILDYYEVGQQSSKVGMPVVNLSPYRAAENIVDRKVVNLSPAMQQVGDQLITWRKEWEKSPEANQVVATKENPYAREMAFNQWVKGKEANPTGIPIFSPMPLKQVVGLNKNAASLPVWNNVLKPAAEAGANVDDPNTAFGIITSAVVNKQISYKDAADYSVLVGHALNAKNMGNNLIAFGLKGPSTVPAQISVDPLYGKDNVNIVDQLELSRALNRTLSHSIQSGRMSGVN